MIIICNNIMRNRKCCLSCKSHLNAILTTTRKGHSFNELWVWVSYYQQLIIHQNRILTERTARCSEILFWIRSMIWESLDMSCTHDVMVIWNWNAPCHRVRFRIFSIDKCARAILRPWETWHWIAFGNWRGSTQLAPVECLTRPTADWLVHPVLSGQHRRVHSGWAS